MPDDAAVEAALQAALNNPAAAEPISEREDTAGEPWEPLDGPGEGWTATPTGDVAQRPHEGVIVDAEALEAGCTEDEARAMVAEVHESLERLDNAMGRIVSTRAWLALGYDNPSDFMVKEMGPAGGGPVSARHAYRLARYAAVLYELSNVLGVSAEVLDLTERGLRALPAGRNRENDDVFLERIRAAAQEKGQKLTVEEANAVLGATLDAATVEAAQNDGLISRDSDLNFDDLDSLSLSGGDFTVDHRGSGDSFDSDWDEDDEAAQRDRDGFSASGGAAPDRDAWDGPAASGSRTALLDAYADDNDPNDAAISYSDGIEAVKRGLRDIESITDALPGILAAFTDDDLLTVVDRAAAARAVFAAVTHEADQRGFPVD